MNVKLVRRIREITVMEKKERKNENYHNNESKKNLNLSTHKKGQNHN